MSIKRDDFPATSIGRTAGNRLQSPGLETHPLLSPRPASPATSDHGSTTGGASLNNNNSNVHTTRYVPYTPRQRVTPTAATTGTTVHPSSPQHQSGDATSKLQVMHLKAAARMMGLDNGTLGWAMLERLVLDGDVGDEWTEVWNAITSGKATLLLPLETSSTNERITPDFVKDHIVLCDGLSRNNAPIVTLSGLRGTLEDETLTFRSTINTSSKLFQDLLTPSTRTSSLSRLPPLPSPFPNIPPISYPKYQLTTHTPSLHLPPRSHPSNPKPPLPPRPNIRAQPISAPRISNPFASLFSKSTPQPQTPPPPPPPPPSPPTSLRSIDLPNDTTTHVEISAFAIDRPILLQDLAKETNKSLRSELKACIKSKTQTSLPPWVTQRIHDLTNAWYPFLNARNKVLTKSMEGGVSNKDHPPSYVVHYSIDENLEDVSEHLQDFFTSLEQDLRLAGDSRKVGKDSVYDVEDVMEREKGEAKIREIMEVVERLITWLFYDRLFSQPTTDDASHDEALSNRIAALNMLDLGLGHLGIDIGEVNEPDLDAVVKACGEMLSQLDSCRCPADKASILVAAHKIIVDGLARLPPVRLTSESDEAESQESDDGDDDDDDVPLTAKPKSPSAANPPVLDNHTDLDPKVLATTALPPEPTSQSPANNDDTSPPTNKDPQPTTEPKPKAKGPPPPPLNLDNPQPPRLKKDPTPVSGDVLFPLIIFSVVKANPSRLVSNLLFTQRFRNHQSIAGEESYCLINMMAVAEFLENVDMGALGLDNTDKVLSTADLTPILSSRSPVTTETPLLATGGGSSGAGGGGGLRGRVEQQVDAITDSANKVISGVVDSSFGILRSFMPVGGGGGGRSGKMIMTPGTPGTPGRKRMSTTTTTTGLGLLRRDSGFSIASLAASLPIAGRARLSGGGAGGEEVGQQMISVVKPGLRSSPKVMVNNYEEESDDDDDEDEDEDGESVSSSKEESESDGGENISGVEPERSISGDARSIRSFESMLRDKKNRKGYQRQQQQQQQPRKTLSDRLASVSALAKGSSPRSSLYVSSSSHQRSKSTSISTVNSRSNSPAPVESLTGQLNLAPPNERFMECEVDDLRLSEVGELLREYRRLVDGVRSVGGFFGMR